MVLISDGEYQYEYDDFLKAVGALDTSKNSGYSYDNDPPPESKNNFDYMKNNFVPSVNIDPNDRIGFNGMGSNQFSKELNDFLPKTTSLNTNQGNQGSQGPYPPTPDPATKVPISTTKPAVKIAGPQYVEFKPDNADSGDQDFLKILFFENINGIALLSLVNSASLETANIQYQPILNMAETQNALDPKTLLALQDTLDKYFLQFPIKLSRTIPTVGYGPNGEHVYLDLTTGNLTISVINLGLAENIEIQTLQNGTIYNTNLGNEES